MKRERFLQEIELQLQVQPVCVILGPRQVGKTTLAKMFLEKFPQEEVAYFDLEDPLDVARLENPMLALSPILNKIIVIDEVQKIPELFPVIRVLVDREKKGARFLILGSASRDLIRQSSETLAGRVGYVELSPFSFNEIKDDEEKLWMRGGFPRSFLAETDEKSYLWRKNYIATFLERDIPLLGFAIPPEQMRRFWLMLAHYHGNIFNASELGKSLGISDHTARKYLDILAGTFMVRSLPPWFENLQKRQVKSPKIYFRDSGILHALIGIRTQEDLQTHPRLGSFWEGFALEETVCTLKVASEDCYFWATHADAELDLFVLKNGKRLGFEFKFVDAPKITKSMRIAMSDLKLDHLGIVYPGDHVFPMDEKITAYGLKTLGTGK